jgi:hypothetical protein
MKNSLKNCRGVAVRSPLAALRIIVPKTLACANIQKSQRKAFHMKNSLVAAHSARKIAEAALIARLRPLCALLYPRLWHVQTFKSHKEKRST